ncbi:hypothetical protein KP509_11G070000 [Ceratopteris richardii]|nr:hypothetical protein KP509_11G070000 [Ceratopteris richardii]
MAVNKTKKSFVKMKKIKAHLVECRKTQKLDMSSLELTEIPEDFMNLVKTAGVTSITELDLHRNQLSDLANELIEFRTLKILKLNRNKFQVLPAVVLRFSKLQVLDLSENEVKELDLGIQFLVSLRELNFSKNQLMVLPDFWSHLTLLVVLNIAKNRLMELPESLGSLRSLQRLDISDNLLSSLPKALQNLHEIVTLDVHGNHLVEVPPSLGLLKNLIEFDCSGNPLSETVSTFYHQGFEKFMDYLRNLHDLQQLEELIRQKPEGQVLGSYKKYCARYEIGQRPLLRTGHSITQGGPITYIFGGRVTNYVKVEETYAIDSRTLLWVKLSTSGSIPTARDGHAAAFDGNKRLFIFGGRNEENKLLNDVYYLDLKTMTWLQPAVEGSIPAVREGASMVVIGFQLILFGGRGSRQRYNDVHVLDTQAWTWTLQNTRGSIPGPRQNAAATCLGSKLYVHGGKGSLLLDDLHSLDTLNFTWSRVSQKGFGPSPRYKHYCWIHQSRLFVVGGLNKSGEPLSSLYVLPLSTETRTDTSGSFQERTSTIQAKNYTWTELDSELEPCISNLFCHCGEKMVVFQEGPQHTETIPYCSEELSNLEGSSWDYYMEVNCDTLQHKVNNIQMERPMDSKTARVLFTKQTQILQLPKSFQACSDKETHLLEYIKSYERRFNQIHPERRLFMFAALNECGVEKCICTTVRPSHADFTELFHWETCASFLADFLTYEPLEDPLTFPSYLPSPVSVLSWQKADCFDFAMVLVSFLTGAGYEAFCVVGYAPLSITTNNQEAIACPYLALKDKEAEEAFQEKDHYSPSKKLSKVKNTNYIYEALPDLNAEYLNLQKHQRDVDAINFIRSFETTFDHDLRMGENEEEDNLFLYCHERPSTKLLSKETLEAEESQNPVTNRGQDFISTMNHMNDTNEDSRNHDILDTKRLHCWVLLTPNKRDLSHYFFLEPSTGKKYSLHESPYQGVEYIWNQHNIFINMQPNEHRLGIKNMSWDLKDISKWERVLDTYLSAGDIQEPTPVNIKASPNILNPNKRKDIHTSVTPGFPINTDAKLEVATLPGASATVSTENNSPLLASKPNVKPAGPLNISKETVEKTVCEDPIKNGFVKPYHWLLPASWVPVLNISIDAYITRCPQGVKKTHYYRCTHELYSFYGDFVRWDGLIERMILYHDDERTSVFEIHDYFQRRKDCLRKRIFIPDANKVHDFFTPGASFGLKEMEIIDGNSRKFLFYSSSRTDGLIMRDEILGKRITENFKNHEACLVYRCVCYGPPLTPPQDEFSPKPLSDRHLESVNETRGEMSVKGSASRPGSVRLSSRPISHGGRISVDSQKARSRSRMMSRWQSSSSHRRKTSTPTSEKTTEKKLLPAPKRRPVAEKLLPIVKITQKYELRNDARPKDNVAKHVFKLSVNQIKVEYHHMNRHITSNSHMYNKDGSLTLLHIDPFTPEQTQFDRLDEFHSLVTAEREAIKSVRDTEREIEEILQQRLREEQNVVLLTPYIDIACVKDDDLFQEGEDSIKLPTDYLSPFLPPGVRPRQKLTRQQMLDVRDSCLKALKERLVNRATIIQTRYDEETTSLAKRRTNFERDREQMTVEDEETYNLDCENALFRIRILELRAKQHEEEALKK